MSLTMQFLKLLRASRDPLMPSAFSTATGSSDAATFEALKYCLSYRYMVKREAGYELTLEGAKRAKYVPKTPAKKLARKATSYAAKTAARRAPANRCPLEMVWR